MNRSQCVLISLLAPFLILAGCRPSQPEASGPVKVEVRKVALADEHHDFSYSGTIEESETIPLSFSSFGTVSKVLVAEGAPVRKGQLLATLDDTTSRNAYEMARATEQRAEDAYKRLTPMYKNGHLPEVKYVEVETALQQAKAAAAIAKKNLDDCRLYATTDGFIGRCSVDPGMVLTANLNSITIVRIAKVFARVGVPEDEIVAVEKGEQGTVTIGALGSQPFTGTVEEIGVVADPLAHSYKVKIALANPDGKIKPGMVCSAVLHHASAAAHLMVPHQAVMIDEAGHQFVYVVDASRRKAVRTPVTTGNYVHDGIEILTGLSADDLVVVEGQHKLVDQAAVQVIDQQ